MYFVLTLAYLFFIGSLAGWCIEVVFRKFFSGSNPEHKWINPGFLVGPYIPLYGISLCILYLLAGCEKDIHIENVVVCRLVLFAIMAVCVTAVEYLVGLLCTKCMKVRLWDYSHNWGNIQGIICPLFTFFWAVLSAIYYFLVHPRILHALDWLARNLAFSFFIGFFFGVFVIDTVYSAQLLTKIRRFAVDKGIVVRFEDLKSHIREAKERGRERVFLLAMHSRSTPLSEHLAAYFEKQSERFERFRRPVKKKEF